MGFFFILAPELQNLRQMLMADPVQFEMVKQRFPELASAIQRNDYGRKRFNYKKEFFFEEKIVD